MTGLSDEALRALMRTDAAAGWRAFIDQYTPLIVGSIHRAGLTDRDEVMDVYVSICEQLSARAFERLKSQDASRGSTGGWLAVVTRHAVVDWIRSRKGRRRLFQAVRDLSALDRRVFELYYWNERTPAEIAELLAGETGGRSDLAAIFDALERVQNALTDRHRAELLALAARSTTPIALDDTNVVERAADPRMDPETSMRITQVNARFEAALKQLPPEDAAIVRLKYVEGLTNSRIEQAIGVTGLTARRLQDILARLRLTIVDLGVDAGDVALADRLSLDRGAS